MGDHMCMHWILCASFIVTTIFKQVLQYCKLTSVITSKVLSYVYGKNSCLLENENGI